MAWRGYQIKGRYPCPECGREICVTRMKNLRPHGIRGVTRRCPGSGAWVGPTIDAKRALHSLSSAARRTLLAGDYSAPRAKPGTYDLADWGLMRVAKLHLGFRCYQVDATRTPAGEAAVSMLKEGA